MGQDEQDVPQEDRLVTAAARFEGGTVPARDAATVLLVRDGQDGVEVLVQERHVETDFSGGALVFPGGAVDDDDADLPAELWRGGDPAAVGAALGTDARGGLGLLVAAAREVFEEAGLLLAVHADGSPVEPPLLDEPDVRAARAALAARDDGGDLVALLRERSLVLDLGGLHPFAWWVTPDGMHRRYDTRFFVAAVPPEQADAATQDDVETTSARWLRPAAALAGGEQGRFTIIFPTRRVLGQLAGFDRAADVVDAARQGRLDVTRIQPTVLLLDGVPHVRVGEEPPERP